MKARRTDEAVERESDKDEAAQEVRDPVEAQGQETWMDDNHRAETEERESDKDLPTLFMGTEDTENVVVLQRRLRALGENIRVDGEYGSVTRNVVIQLQRARNLDPNGVVGEETWQAISQAERDKGV